MTRVPKDQHKYFFTVTQLDEFLRKHGLNVSKSSISPRVTRFLDYLDIVDPDHPNYATYEDVPSGKKIRVNCLDMRQFSDYLDYVISTNNNNPIAQNINTILKKHLFD